MPAKPAAPPVLYRIRSPFTAWEDGVPIPYNDRSVIYTSDHPMVKRHTGNFEVVETVGPPRRAVETTTANPGESR